MESLVTRVMGFLPAKFELSTPFRKFRSRLRDRQMNRQTAAINGLYPTLLTVHLLTINHAINRIQIHSGNLLNWGQDCNTGGFLFGGQDKEFSLGEDWRIFLWAKNEGFFFGAKTEGRQRGGVLGEGQQPPLH